MAFNQPLNLSEQDIRTVQPQTQPSGASFTPSIKFGQVGSMSDGTTYVFAANGSSAQLAAGKTAQSPAQVANHQLQTLTVAAAIGATTLTMPIGATAVVQSQYAEGNLVVVSGTGKGYRYRIKDNVAGTLSTTVTLTLRDPILVALDTTSVVSLYPSLVGNNYYTGVSSGVVITPTSSPTTVIGVSPVNVPVSNYYWSQIQGFCSVLQNGTIAANTGIVPSATTAGAVDTEATGTITQRLGYTLSAAGTSTDYQPVLLNIMFGL